MWVIYRFMNWAYNCNILSFRYFFFFSRYGLLICTFVLDFLCSIFIISPSTSSSSVDSLFFSHLICNSTFCFISASYTFRLGSILVHVFIRSLQLRSYSKYTFHVYMISDRTVNSVSLFPSSIFRIVSYFL